MLDILDGVMIYVWWPVETRGNKSKIKPSVAQL